MPRLRLVADLPQNLLTGPIWEPGEEQDLSDEEAAPYLTNANWRVVPTITVDAPNDPSPVPASEPAHDTAAAPDVPHEEAT